MKYRIIIDFEMVAENSLEETCADFEELLGNLNYKVDSIKVIGEELDYKDVDII